jgi:hypothetical protein
MKQLLIITVVHLASVLSATKVIAQENSVTVNNRKTPALTATTIGSAGTGSSLQPVAVNNRLNKKFTRHFAEATDAVWSKSAHGFEVKFTSKGIQSRVHLT